MISGNKSSPWSSFKRHLKGRMVTGLAVLVPIGFTFLVLRFLFRATSGLLAPIVDRLVPQLPDMAVAIASIAILFLVVYAAGTLTTFFLGRRIIGLGESLVAHIPLVRTIYNATKQTVQALSLQHQEAFRGVVWIEFPSPGFLTLGFVTGMMRDRQGVEYYKIFIPTAPNPTSGFFQVVLCSDTRATDITVEEAMKTIMSGGILSPKYLEGEESG